MANSNSGKGIDLRSLNLSGHGIINSRKITKIPGFLNKIHPPKTLSSLSHELHITGLLVLVLVLVLISSKFKTEIVPVFPTKSSVSKNDSSEKANTEEAHS